MGKQLRGTGRTLRVLLPVLLFLLTSSSKGQWREVQLHDGDMAADLAEALTFTKYPTYPQYLEMMQYFAESYPEICRVDTFGTSEEGRLLLALKISDHVYLDEAEAAFLYTSSMHGNELLGYPMMLRLISYLLTGYGEDAEVNRLVDGLEIWINPLANPDGTYFPNNDFSVAQSIRGTADSTDMNREFPDPLKGEAVNDTSGKAVETKAMMAFLQEHSFTMSANIHSGAEVVNYPWDHTYDLHADDAWFRYISREYADEAKAADPEYMSLFTDGITNGALWYKVFGGRQDYVNYYLGGREVTLELCSEFRLASKLLDEYWQKNERSLLNYMAQCLYGIRGTVSDSESGLPVEALVEIPGHDQYHSAIHSSAAHGDFYRLIEEGSYDLVVSAPGYLTDTIIGLEVENYQATMLEVKLQALPSSLENNHALSFRIWPNPASSELFIQPGKGLKGQLLITIFSTEGIILAEKQIYSTGEAFSLPIEILRPGFYLLSISTGEHTLVKALIKE